ncbi:hypothetical protein KKF84_02585 [Myxococcota bacterium]|nr:hypothetical protein [Myxococcota bacterium]MBU1534176.1 hypothetical protein [Myxococcota bacterium]
MKNILLMTIVISGMAIVTTGCSKGKSDKKEGKVASCNMPKLQSCREYRDDNLALGTDMLRTLCGKTGDFKDTACPEKDLIGTCKVSEHKDFFYKGYVIPLKSLEKSCNDKKGKWDKMK